MLEIYKQGQSAMNENDGVPLHDVILTDINLLKPHPQNYRFHPINQVEEFIASIREFGIYKPIVTAIDHTILVGHGITQACQAMGLAEVPVVRTALKSDSKDAIKLMIGDNETPNMGQRDNQKLSELLKGIPSLKGTGFDAAMMADLLFVTRADEPKEKFDHEGHWAGMPEFSSEDKSAFRTIKIHMADQESVDAFGKLLNANISPETKYLWYPILKVRWVKHLKYDDPEAGEGVKYKDPCNLTEHDEA